MKLATVALGMMIAGSAFASESTLSMSQTWTCRLNETATSKLVEKETIRVIAKNSENGLGIEASDASSFSLKIAGNKIVGGYLKSQEALGNSTWELDQAGPDADQAEGPRYSVRNVEKKWTEVLRTGLDIDGWDHYNYTIDLKTESLTATVIENIQLDCCDPIVAYGVYDCQVEFAF